MLLRGLPWFACLLPVPLFAVGSTGNLVGTVTDPAGLPVNGATVVVRDQGTGAVRQVFTNLHGYYSVILLRPAVYDLTVEVPHFRKAVIRNIKVGVDETVRAEVPLALGEVRFSVDVTAPTPLLETDRSSLGQVVDRRKIAELPLNERNFLGFLLLVPGAQTPAEGSQLSFEGAAGAVSVNGAREQANNYLLDGVDNNNIGFNQYSVLPPLESVEEFKVQASNSSAEFGRSGGAQINVVLRSGTNNLHGSAYEFFRNRHLDARNFFDPGTVPKFNRNQFGGSLGGPVRKNKTFFFASYEGLRLRQASTRQATVPSQAQKEAALAAVPPPARNPAGAAILALYPDANAGRNTFVASPITRNTLDQLVLRMDQHQDSANSFSGHYALYSVDRFDPYALLSPFTNLPGFGALSRDLGQSGRFTWTRVSGARLVNEARIGFNRQRHGFLHESSGLNRSAQLGFPAISPRAVDWGYPDVSVAGFDGIGESIVLPQDSASNTFHFADNLSWEPAFDGGRHRFQFGADIRPIRFNSYLDVFARGNWNFLGITGDPLQDLLLGIPAFVLAAGGDTHSGLRTTQLDFSAQDDFRVTGNLTLNLGLRYEYNSPPVEAHDRLSVPDLSAAALACSPKPDCEFLRAGTGDVPRSTFRGDRNNFAPRLGLAWRVSPFAVVRAAYGIFYDTAILNRSIFPRLNPPFFHLNVLVNGGADNIQSLVGRTALPVPSQSAIIDPHAREAYMQDWNLNVQFEISPNQMIEAAYVGSEGTHLLRQFNLNQPRPAGTAPFPQFGPVRFIAADASSDYHSLQLTGERRLSQGIAFLAAYTWSKSIDDASALFGTATEPGLPQDSLNARAERGLSNFHTAHRFVLSYLHDLPFGAGRRWLAQPSWRRSLFGNWHARAIASVQTGHPFTVNRAVDQSRTDTTLAFADRPDLVADPFRAGPVMNNPDPACRITVAQGGRAAAVVRDPASWFNPCAFAAPATPRFGTAGRNVLIGPGMADIDVSLLKEIPLPAEGHRVQLRFECFNVLNHPNFDSPNRVFDSQTFAAVPSANAYGNKPPRQIQLAARYVF